MQSSSSFVLKKILQSPEHSASDFLARESGLSKGRVKDAMNKGAVWVKRVGKKEMRLRRATASLGGGDEIALYYDADILALVPPDPVLVHDQGRYSVWDKPAGLLTQGSRFGDHCSLVRQAELFFMGKRQIFPVHRLDREASGLVLLAHDSQAAGMLSVLFRGEGITKVYRAEVLGDLSHVHGAEMIDAPVDGKPALTEFTVESFDQQTNTSRVRVVLHTGRKHQIRRHFDSIGHPVIGDPRYGQGNKNEDGLQLRAVRMEFVCPISGKPVLFRRGLMNFPAESLS
ncbi:MAG: RluA family pseudouridine synthase [Desulfovibrionales bacterium]